MGTLRARLVLIVDSGNRAVVILLDLHVTFDRVGHCILIVLNVEWVLAALP